MTFELTEDNFLFFAIKHYDNPACKGIDEFEDDLKRFSYIKRLFNKPGEESDLRTRLILNHIVVLCNLFGTSNIANMLFLKIEEKYWIHIKTYLTYLNCMPDSPMSINGKTIRDSDIPLDQSLIDFLRKL
jgi:hypothetical protein